MASGSVWSMRAVVVAIISAVLIFLLLSCQSLFVTNTAFGFRYKLMWTALTSTGNKGPMPSVARASCVTTNGSQCHTNASSRRLEDIGTTSTDDLPRLNGEHCIKRLPQSIIGGVAKSGTKALITFLDRHPQIAACMQPGEVHYFDRHYDEPLSWYRKLMSCSYSHQITIEKTPDYNHLHRGPEVIKEMNSATKVILIYKEPIYRAHSVYLMNRAHHKVDTGVTFANAVLDQDNKVIDTSAYVKTSVYVQSVLNWQRVFPPEQLCFVDGQKLETDPVSELSRIETFLNISHFLTNYMFVYNETKGKYCLADVEGTVSCLSEGKGRFHPDLGKELILTLQDYFKPFNEEFFALIGRRFDWGY